MRIVIFAGYYYPHTGGYIKNIHELAVRLIARGHSVTVITSKTNRDDIGHDELDGVAIIRLPAWNLLGGSFPALDPLRLLHKLPQQSDVVITQTRFFTTSLLGTIYAMVKGLPHIHVERGSTHSITGSRITNLIAMLVDHTLGSLIVRSACICIGVSQAASLFASHLGSKHTITIPNGIRPSCAIPASASPWRTIGFIGRLVYAKGVQDLIRAFDTIGSKHKDAHLIIVGDGNYKDTLMHLSQQSRHGDRIVFYGDMEQRRALEVMARCDIIVNTSYSEGLPTSVLEAANMGKAIIATDVGGTREIITDRISGLLYSPGNTQQLIESLDSVLTDPVAAGKLGINAAEATQSKFSWEPIVDLYENVLKEAQSR